MVEQVVMRLNDVYCWTRERIADWVETVEPAQVESVRPHADTRDVSSGVHAETRQLEKAIP